MAKAVLVTGASTGIGEATALRMRRAGWDVYAASKHGLEAISDSLRRELRPWGINVSVIEPGAVVTPIPDRAHPELEVATSVRRGS